MTHRDLPAFIAVALLALACVAGCPAVKRGLAWVGAAIVATGDCGGR